MASLKIILLCILAAVVYGVLHDQVTARVCVEYFTVGHAPIFNTESPTLLAFGWGTLATWWVGLILGVLSSLVSRTGSWPKVEAANLIRPIACLLIVMAVTSLLAGVTGYQLAKDNRMVLPEPYGPLIPKDRHYGFFADSVAHLAAYMVGALGGLVLCARVFVQRRRMASTKNEETAYPARPADHWIVIVSRWTGGTIGVPLLGLIAVIILGDGVSNPLTASSRDNLLGTIILMMLFGLILAWKWEGLASLLIFGALVLFAIVNRGHLLNIVIAPWLTTGLLYLVCWWMRPVEREATE